MKKEQLQDIQAEHKTQTQLRQAIDLEYTKICKKKDKKDKSTLQDVFDAKTLKTLNKLYANNIIKKLDSAVISSGKEANVYYTRGGENDEEYAVKIYKTMTMTFKEREEYISGEFRFKDQGKNKRTNAHKLIAVWAEKEIRNLKRIQKIEGIRVPKAIHLKENILVMEFIGENKIAAKRLRDVKLDKEQISNTYIEVIQLMRKLFIQARLVHGDLSEYNMLYYKQELILIDVSQSMEDSHPLAIEFLKRDIYNINKYFSEQGVIVFSMRQIFKYITDRKQINEQDRIDEMMQQAIKLNIEQDKIEFESFMDVNIPQSLFELDILDIERIIEERKKMKQEGLIEELPIYSNLTGMIDNQQEDDIKEEKVKERKQKVQELTPEEQKQQKKENKKKVKEENKKKRQEKMPKKQKKKLLKKTKRNK